MIMRLLVKRIVHLTFCGPSLISSYVLWAYLNIGLVS